MIAVAETIRANSASVRSFFPMAGPISETLSTVCGLAGKPFRRRPMTFSPTIFSSFPRSLTLMRMMFSSVTAWRLASGNPPVARVFRTWSIATGCSNRTWMEVPLARSIPRFARPVKIWKMANRPNNTITPEKANAYFLSPMKSMLVFLMISNIVVVVPCAPFPRPAAGWSDAQGLHRPLCVEVVEHDFGADERREEVDGHPHREGDGEPLDRAGPELEQDHRGDQGGHVGVDDGPEGLLVACVDRGPDRLFRPQLIADPLEDEDVGVDRHPDGEDDPRDPGERERRLQQGHPGEQEQDVEDQGEVRHQTREPVVGRHEPA